MALSRKTSRGHALVGLRTLDMLVVLTLASRLALAQSLVAKVTAGQIRGLCLPDVALGRSLTQDRFMTGSRRSPGS